MKVLHFFLISTYICLIMADEEQEKVDKAEYKRLTGKVGGHKTYLTKLSNSIAEFVDGDERLEGERLIEAEQHQATIELRLVTLQSLFDDLLAIPLISDEDITNFDIYMRGIKSKLAKLKFKIDSSKSKSVPAPPGSTAETSAGLCDSAVKYPEIKLPKFGGGSTGTRDFRPFYQIFKALVEDKEGIPPIYKIQYLRSCLPEGSEAYNLVYHIPATAENYDLHIETLKGRYNNTAGEANRLRRSLMQVGTWSVCNSVDSQRRLVDHVKQNLALLTQIEEIESDDLKCLVTNMLEVLPDRLKFKVAEMRKEDRTVLAILDLLEVGIERKLEVKSFSDSAKKQPERRNHQPQSSKHYSYAYHSAGQVKEDRSRPCLYCHETGHTPHKCTKLSKESRAAIIEKERRCWNCLGEHPVRSCKAPSRCSCSQKGKHSQSLCGITPPWRVKSAKQSGGLKVDGTVDVASLITSEGSSPTFLSTIELEVDDKWGQPLKLRLLLDGAATHSYGKKGTVSRLPVIDKVGSIDMTVSTFSGLRKISTRMVELELPGNKSINLVLTDNICEPLHGNNLDQETRSELEQYQLADPASLIDKPLPIDILVGVDNFWKLVTDQVVRLKSGLVIMSTHFGWVLSGELSNKKSIVHGGTYLAHTLVTHGGWRDSRQYGLNAQDSWYNPQAHALCAQDLPVSGQEDLNEVKCDLEKFWDLDTLGIKPEREVSPVLENFLDTLKQDEDTGRYEVSLPQRSNIVNLPSNFNNSQRRLDSLWKKFSRPGNEEFARKYHAVIEDQLQQGVIERVVLSEAEIETLREKVSKPFGVNFIPHHGVLKERSDKVRPVYDGSACAYKGALSLNDCLLKGPNYMNLLAEVLLNFRLHSIVLLADIRKAFLQISVAKEDRDLLRFLWYDKDGNLEIYRFTRVPFGTGPSPFLLNATLRHHLEKTVADQSLLELLLRSIYVDDILTGGEDLQFVLELRKSLVPIFDKAAMELHGWNSNSAEVREALGVTDDNDDTVVLGVCWNRKVDVMGLNLEKVLRKPGRACTKRELLRATAQFYDPHGLLNPVVLVPKLLFRSVCSRKLKWDDELPEDVASKWIEWREQLPLLEEVRWQRHALLPGFDRLELHGFSDASKVAYSAAVYLKSSRGEVSQSHLVMCKNRVSPQKELSIPRLELMGALLLARLMAVVVAFLKPYQIDSIVYYTDSMNVLYWLRTEHKMWAVFVACRIKEINSLSNFIDWKYVPTKENPADLPTRGLKPAEIVNNKLWFHGPDFICSGRVVQDVDSSHPPAVCLQERRKVVHLVVPVETGVGSVMKIEDFSTAHKLFSRTVWYLRFMYWLAKKHLKNAGDRFDFSRPELYSQARLLWLKFTQAEHYSVELKFLKNNPATVPSGMKVPSSILKQLDLSLDQNGLLHVGTRLKHAPLPEAAKSPILLPSDSYLSKLFIKDTHHRLMHGGVRQVMDSIRGWSWIPQCRRTISKILRACVNCRKFQADFYPAPDPPPLPDFRVQKVDAWETIGVDHCGPFLAYPKPVFSTAKRGKPVKVYVLIFTCAVTRGVNLELVEDMSVESFMLGFRRFVSSHGLPSYILSDNGSTFVCAGKELTAILNHPKFQRYMGSRNIKWEHYLEYAPWWGGWIERLNRIFKSSLRKVLGGACVAMWEFYTFLKECEAVMNSRPLTYVYDDVQEGQAITPSMLWCGKDLTQLPPDMFTFRFGRKAPMTCKERLKHLSKRKTYFKTRFLKEYLTGLTERHATSRHGFDVREPKVGDTVLINDKASSKVKIPRNRWNLGRILTLHPGRDGKVRSVDVRMVVDKGEEPCVLRHKSPSQLVPLEAGDDSFW